MRKVVFLDNTCSVMKDVPEYQGAPRLGRFGRGPGRGISLHRWRRNPADWGERIEITRLSRREGLMVLAEHSFAAHIVEALSMQPRRLGLFASLVGEDPVCRITYPNGFEHLPYVGRAILDGLAQLPYSGRCGG